MRTWGVSLRDRQSSSPVPLRLAPHATSYWVRVETGPYAGAGAGARNAARLIVGQVPGTLPADTMARIPGSAQVGLAERN